jgi:mannosyltransferase OCH1-like enzyme
MTIDIWRVLILYKYGGIYTDIDNWPEDAMNENLIPKNVSGFFLSDSWNRPSQWFMSAEKGHPIFYFTMLLIIEKILDLPQIGDPKVVFVTGPHVVKEAYSIWLTRSATELKKTEPTYDIFQQNRIHHGVRLCCDFYFSLFLFHKSNVM